MKLVRPANKQIQIIHMKNGNMIRAAFSPQIIIPTWVYKVMNTENPTRHNTIKIPRAILRTVP